ncbi:hypothetical protein [Rubrobacter calidifluminis]|uniref:hypothetical protein n=1 Tax=Rubrobacter calidifluminis TaxID=1392640 RepID=UPI00235E4C42|nr:hypothetical protein [Rubrobacter calidifluminis]
MEDASDKIQFFAYLPEIQSAVSIGRDSSRIKLDVPETDIAAAIRLAAYGRGKSLRVTVEIEGDEL